MGLIMIDPKCVMERGPVIDSCLTFGCGANRKDCPKKTGKCDLNKDCFL